jgi:hypothetical protein
MKFVETLQHLAELSVPLPYHPRTTLVEIQRLELEREQMRRQLIASLNAMAPVEQKGDRDG